MRCPHWRYGLRSMGMGYCVGLGAALGHALPTDLRVFLIAGRSACLLLDRGGRLSIKEDLRMLRALVAKADQLDETGDDADETNYQTNPPRHARHARSDGERAN